MATRPLPSGAPVANDRGVQLSSVAPLPKKAFYQPELDSLRFLAFLSVCFYHYIPGEPTFYKGWPHAITFVIGAAVTAGSFGVPVFFVLSAYLITNLLLREKDRTGNLDTRSFYIRRILRIWPLYYAFLAVVCLLPFIARYQHMPLVYMAGYAFLVGNWVQAIAAYSQASLMAHPLWTVSIEEQFYLLWPLVVRKASRISIARIAIALLIIANLSRILLAFSHVHDWPRIVNLGTLTNVDSIALGVLLALFLKQPPRFSFLQRVALFFVCIFVLVSVGGFYVVHEKTGAIIGVPLAAFASAGILVSFLGVKNYVIRNPVMQYLGKISYGLYVIHVSIWLCIAHFLKESARYQTLGGRLEIALPALAITIGVASISYKWFESPFLRLKQRFTHVDSRPV